MNYRSSKFSGASGLSKGKVCLLKKDLIERFQDSTTHFEKKTCLAGANNPRHTEYIFYASIAVVSTSTYSVLNVACYCLTFKGITKIHSLQLLIL